MRSTILLKMTSFLVGTTFLLATSSFALGDYVSDLLALNPDHYYQLNETVAGTATDSGTNAITAFHAGAYGVGAAEVGVQGVMLPGFSTDNKALNCNDAGGLQLGDAASFAAETMTISFWMKNPAPTTDSGYSDRIFQNNSDDNTLTLCYSDVGGIFVAVGTQDTDDRGIGNNDHNINDLWLTQNTWHNYVVVRNGDDITNAKVYIDGVDRTPLMVETPHAWGNTPASAWTGCRDAIQGLGFMAGQLDEVALWMDRALTENEVQSLYSTAIGPQPTYTGYAGDVIASDPIAYYRFDDPAELAAGDAVQNALIQPSERILGYGTAGTGVQYPETVPTFGQTGALPSDTIGGQTLDGIEIGNTAAQFLGNETGTEDSTDMINLGSDPAMNVGTLTYSFLFKTESTAAWTRMVASDPENEGNDFYVLLHEGTLLVAANRDGSQSIRTTDTYNDGQWHHLVAVRDDTESALPTLFIDGAKVTDTGTFTESLSAPPSARIGARIGSSTGYQGLLDEFVIWDRALTDTEAVALFSSLVGGQNPQLPGDANKDGKVDGSDVTILAGNWQHGVTGLANATWEMGDFNGDGKVDGSDVTILAGNWQAGVTTNAASVPEPGILALLLGAMVTLFFKRYV